MNASAAEISAALDPRFTALDRLFFVIGAQKAGTTWVQHYLSKHPQVCVPVFKELNYWSSVREGRDGSGVLKQRMAQIDARPLPRRLLAKILPSKRIKSYSLVKRMMEGELPGHSGYADALFQVSKGERIAGEINPQYALLSPATLSEMAAMARDVRFVFLMRDPVARMFSGIKHSVRRRFGEDGVTDARVRESWEQALATPNHSALVRSRYHVTLGRLDAVVPSTQVAFFFFETMFSQPEVDRLTAFIGADPRPANVDTARHESAGRTVSMPPDLAERSLEALTPTYEYVRARFGGMIPASWRKPKPEAGEASAPKTREA